jgi:probable rRNA maturation factor
MSIDIVQLKSCPDFDRKKLELVISSLLAEFEVTKDLSYILTDDPHVHQLNRDFRQKDMTTDVLSFEMNDDIYPASPLGEVYISLDRASEQAHRAGHLLQQEVAHLAIHGTLHLLGYEHDTEEGYRRMVEKERQHLSHLRPPRNL